MNIEIIPVTAFQQNCSLIWDDEKNAAIIDPGGEAPRLIARIEELGLHLRTILLTHGHLDHVGLTLKSGAHRKKIVSFLKVYHSNLSSLVCLIFLHLHPIAGLIKKVKKFKLANLPLKFCIFLVIHLATLVSLNMKKILLLLAMSFSKTVLVVQTSLVGISTH